MINWNYFKNKAIDLKFLTSKKVRKLGTRDTPVGIARLGVLLIQDLCSTPLILKLFVFFFLKFLNFYRILHPWAGREVPSGSSSSGRAEERRFPFWKTAKKVFHLLEDSQSAFVNSQNGVPHASLSAYLVHLDSVRNHTLAFYAKLCPEVIFPHDATECV